MNNRSAQCMIGSPSPLPHRNFHLFCGGSMDTFWNPTLVQNTKYYKNRFDCGSIFPFPFCITDIFSIPIHKNKIIIHVCQIITRVKFLLLLYFYFLQEYVDIELFLVSRKVEESLVRREIGPCLAWCYENKSKLRKLKVCTIQTSFYNH